MSEVCHAVCATQTVLSIARAAAPQPAALPVTSAGGCSQVDPSFNPATVLPLPGQLAACCSNAQQI